MSQREIIVLEHPTALAQKAAELFIEIGNQSIENKGRFLVAVAGGSTPQKMYGLLAQEPLTSRIDWEKVDIFLSDERFVPLDSEESNFRMLKGILLDKIPILKENTHPILTESLTIEMAAKEHENQLRSVSGEDIPSFDVIFLGLGPDGHTASLFPDLYEPNQNESIVLTIHNSPKPPSDRISFSMKLINNAKNIIVLASGKEKAKIVKEIVENPESPKTLPAAMIAPQNGRLFWLLDQEAASLLRN